MADADRSGAQDAHLVWWDGEDQEWSCTCGSDYLVTDIDAERHYHVMRGIPSRTDETVSG